MAIKLDVPMVRQRYGYFGEGLENPEERLVHTRTKRWYEYHPDGIPVIHDCWYSACCMVAYYHAINSGHSAGPRYGSPYAFLINHAPTKPAYLVGTSKYKLTMSLFKVAKLISESQYCKFKRSIDRFFTFLDREELIPLPFEESKLTPSFFETSLRSYGPIMAGIRYETLEGHAIVICGVDNDYVYYNDPYTGATHRENFSLFLLQLKGPKRKPLGAYSFLIKKPRSIKELINCLT